MYNNGQIRIWFIIQHNQKKNPSSASFFITRLQSKAYLLNIPVMYTESEIESSVIFYIFCVELYISYKIILLT